MPTALHGSGFLAHTIYILRNGTFLNSSVILQHFLSTTTVPGHGCSTSASFLFV